MDRQTNEGHSSSRQSQNSLTMELARRADSATPVTSNETRPDVRLQDQAPPPPKPFSPSGHHCSSYIASLVLSKLSFMLQPRLVARRRLFRRKVAHALLLSVMISYSWFSRLRLLVVSSSGSGIGAFMITRLPILRGAVSHCQTPLFGKRGGGSGGGGLSG